VPRRLKHWMKRDLTWSASKDVSVHMLKSWPCKDSCVCLLALHYFWVIHIFDQAYSKWQSPKSVFSCNESNEEPNFCSQTMDCHINNHHSHFTPSTQGILYENLDYYVNWKRWNYEVNGILWKIKYMQHVRNAVNFFVVCTYIHLHM